MRPTSSLLRTHPARTHPARHWIPLGLACAAALAVGLGCPASQSPQVVRALSHARSLERAGSPRIAVAALLDEARHLRALGDPSGGARLLARAFALRGSLTDDRALRVVLDGWPADQLPPSLRAAKAFEQAQRRFSQGDSKAARRALPALATAAEATAPLDAARVDLLHALLDAAAAPPQPQSALARLQRVTRAPLEGPLGASLTSLAWLTLGSLHYDAKRMGPAIRAYLRVGRRSGRWREARLAMAWCQFRLQRPERAHAILAQLPGGASGDPEAALLDALSLHALGQLDAARAVIDAARARAQGWDAKTVTRAAVLRAAAQAERPSLDQEPPMTLARLVALGAPVWTLAREVLATDRALKQAATDNGDDRQALARYRGILAAALDEAVATRARLRAAAASRAVRDLATLRPQIVPLVPAGPHADGAPPADR